jgi:hypothetical protein
MCYSSFEVILLHLENARALVQGTLILVFVVIAVWVDFLIGMILVVIMGLLLRRLGFKKKLE